MDSLKAKIFAASLLCLAMAAVGGPAHGQNAHATKINLVVASEVGGGYDTYGRLVAAHISRHLPGQPTVIPQNMPGASGIRAANYLFNLAPKDGSALGILDQAVVLDKILGKSELMLEPAQFNWVGRIAGNNAILFASSTATVKKIDDARSHELIVSASGASAKLRWVILKSVIGLHAQIISSYKGTNDARLAMQRGEIDALSMPWSVLKAQEAPALRDKTINLLMQTGFEKAPDLPDVPRMLDLATNDDDRRLIALFCSPDAIGRSVAAPPGLPAQEVTELRRAFTATVKDPAFLKDIQKLNLELDPLTGEELQTLVISNSQLAPELIKRARDLANAQP